MAMSAFAARASDQQRPSRPMTEVSESDRKPRAHTEQNHVAAWLNLSHELRTPAHAILGHIELLLSGSAGPMSSDMRIHLGELQRAATKLSAQICEVIKQAEAIPAPGAAKEDRGP